MTSLIFWVGVLGLAGFYCLLTMILNVEAGWGGMWDLGTAGLLAAGCYFFVIVTQTGDAVSFAPAWPLWIAWPATAAFTAATAFLIGLPALRLRREYFLIATFAFAEIIRQLAVVQKGLTNGVIGFSSLARPFDDVVASRRYPYVLLAIVAVAVVIVYLITRAIARSPFGLQLRAVRDNDVLGMSLGKHVSRLRVEVFTLAGCLIGAVAPIYMWYIRAITPQLFSPHITFTVWTALVIGGLGGIGGPIAGALVLIVFTEAVGFIDFSSINANLGTALEPFLVGALLMIVLRVRPEGLFSEERAFSRLRPAWRQAASTPKAVGLRRRGRAT